MSMANLLLISALSLPLSSDYEKSHCDEGWDDWTALVERNLGTADSDVYVRLYALRAGLCTMLRLGIIDFQEAAGIFDKEHIHAYTELLRRYEERAESGAEAL